MGFLPSLETLGGGAALVALGSLLLKGYQEWNSRKLARAKEDHTDADTQKIKADAVSVNTGALERIIDRLERSVDRIEIENVNLRTTLRKVEEERDVLLDWRRDHEPYIKRLREEGALPQLKTDG